MGRAASIGRAIRDDISRTLRGVMILAAENVTNATPVDTTNAANNWILSVRSPYGGVDGSRESPSHAAQDAGLARIATYDVVRDGPKIYLRNNVLYLQYLDAGWSQQADAGFVAVALQAAARRAATPRRAAVRKMLRGMARDAYIRTR